ncbi:glycosyltransferase family 4 protein [Terriglobus albidus]|uniref:glycosyltransferase family 4 protein n=1 Tax=Terriglobus albidus TaxID=1592106 RepID=UPI001FE69F36|nr:glycosyltransferase family 1 protein [Terriglobus albidus]
MLAPAGVQLKTSLRRIDVPARLASSAKVSRLRPILWWIYSFFEFPADGQVKILCTTHHVVPRHRGQVVVVHDLRPYFYPDTEVQRLNFRYLLPRALRKCDGILTVSEASRDLIAATYGIDRVKIYVIPQTVDIDVPSDSVPLPREPYLLTVGSTWPHKNVEELLRMSRYWASKYRLRIVGGRGQYMEILRELTNSLGLQSRVDLLSDVPKEDLASLFGGCTALVYPSKMEGFGLPPFEAMAFGKPVILSDIPVFRELHGGLPIYVKLGDEYSWEIGFKELDFFDEERRMQGVVHARSYSRERLKATLFQALEEIWGAGFLKCH